jgi:hypothetical protein
MDIQNLNLNQTPSPKTHKILWTVIGVLILVVMVGAAFWWKEIKTAQVPCIPDCGLGGENNQKANWKTYTNTEYGFEFKYPSVQLLEKQDVKAFDDILFLIKTYESKEDGSRYKTTVSVSNAPFDNFAEIKNDTDFIVLAESKKIINGISWNIISLESKAYKNKFTLAVTVKNNLGFSIMSEYSDQILSTFKFLSPKFTNIIKVQNLSMGIPDGWKLDGVEGNEFRILTETNPYKVWLTGDIKKDDQSWLGDFEIRDGVYGIACGGPMGCYAKKINGHWYSIIFNIESTQPTPEHLDGIWTPTHKFTEEDMINIMATLREINE